MSHPVQLRVLRPDRTDRLQVLVRLVLLMAVGALGWSSLYWALYLGLPALAALLILQKGPEAYAADDGPRILKVLQWLAAAYGYLWLLTDTPPSTKGGPVELRIELAGRPTAGSALARIITSVPAVLLLAILSAVASLFWVAGAICILVSERLPDAIARFLALTLRVQFRLLAYHLSLVERYPSLEAPAPPLDSAEPVSVTP